MNTPAKNAAKIVKVAIGRICLTKAPNILQTVLGSCVGLVVYDADIGLAGLAHIVLPLHQSAASGDMPAMYADRAIPCLVAALREHGAKNACLRAKLAGGARMFGDNPGAGENRDIGASNVAAVEQWLASLRIPLIASACGGDVGCRADFHPATAAYVITGFNGVIKTI